MNEQDRLAGIADAVKSAVPQATENFRWVPPNRVAFFKRWQVQARFRSRAAPLLHLLRAIRCGIGTRQL